MDYVNIVVDSFWAIMEGIVPVITPVIAIILIFTIIRGLLFYER